MRIGIIGIGNMGYRIAKNFLVNNVDVGVFDINQAAVNKLSALGAEIFESPMQLASNYNYIITILPNVDIVKETLLRDDGLLNGFQENSMLIDMTSSIPSVTKELASIVEGKGCRMVDAPVSGGVSKAKDGTLTIMIGGKKEDFDEINPLLKLIGKNIVHMGEIGAGHTIKALNNLISATTLAVTGEALALGTKLGLDANKMLEVINSSTGRSLSSEQKFPKQILPRKFDGGFSLDLMVKDLTIALNLAEKERIPMYVSNASFQLWRNAWRKNDSEMDHTTMIKLIEEMNGVEIKG